MKLSTVVSASVLATTASAWKVGDKATGPTDPNVTPKCTRWANDIAAGDGCKALERSFNLDFLQLHEWVSLFLSHPKAELTRFPQNPSLVIDPCNPIEGWSYCVGSSSPTNSLARNVGTKAPILEDPASTKSTTAAPTAGSSHLSSSSTTTSTTTLDATSISASTTGPTPAQQTGSAASVAPASLAVSVLLVGVCSWL
jgi:hypothetical protein